jgi:hypothetical protein
MRITSIVCHTEVRDPKGFGLKKSFGEKEYDITLNSGRIFEVRPKGTAERVCVPMENVPYFTPALDAEPKQSAADKAVK